MYVWVGDVLSRNDSIVKVSDRIIYATDNIVITKVYVDEGDCVNSGDLIAGYEYIK